MKTILQGIVGSTAYGLATPSSDVDRMGVYIAPTEQHLGFHPPTPTIVTTKPDVTTHEVGKFVSLTLKCNPSVTELLWLDSYETMTTSNWGADLIALRMHMLSAKLVKNAYLGYATQQFKKLLDRQDGTFGPDLAKRTQKHARHLHRLVEQGYELYTTGSLNVRVQDPEAIHEFGRRVEANPLTATTYMAKAEAMFADAKTVLPDHPDADRVESWLISLRKSNWEI